MPNSKNAAAANTESNVQDMTATTGEAEAKLAMLREKVKELLNHNSTACEYTDGWEDALLEVQSFISEND